MAREVIIACDFGSAAELYSFLEAFGSERPFLKIGMELFYAEGPGIVRDLKARGYKVFLDLKLHDIPVTVEKTMRVIAGLGADMVNVHAAGSSRMMKRAAEGLGAGSTKRPLIIAVTELTSIDDETLRDELLIDKPMDEVVMSYALNARDSGLDGVVCSAREAAKVHEVCGTDFLTVTPGIRFKDDDPGDQQRIMTPGEAAVAGSDMIVVGRPISQARDPLKAYHRCVEEFTEGAYE